MIVKPEHHNGGASFSGGSGFNNSSEQLDIVNCLKIENQALKEEAHEARNRVKDLEFENE